MRFKLWQEDVTQPPNSGRRFRNIFRLTSPVHTPYVSLDFRNVDLESWAALITRDGLLTVLEPVSPDTLSTWQEIDQFRVCPEPPRGDETSFRVKFHHDPVDITHLVMPDWDSKSLSLIVAAMDTVKIYRMNADRQFYHALELGGHGGLVRDVAWANGCVRGFDLIASGSSDGVVRVFEVHTEWADDENKASSSPEKAAAVTVSGGGGGGGGGRDSAARTSAQSGIGSALANRTPNAHSDRQRGGEGPFRHSYEEVASIDSRHLDVWQVEFSQAGELCTLHPRYYYRTQVAVFWPYSNLYEGDCLLSSGDDGKVRFWKRAVSGEWLEYAETDMDE